MAWWKLWLDSQVMAKSNLDLHLASIADLTQVLSHKLASLYVGEIWNSLSNRPGTRVA